MPAQPIELWDSMNIGAPQTLAEREVDGLREPKN
jgi:hypothetical protein